MSTARFRGPVRALTSYWYYKDIDLDGITTMLTEDGQPPTLVAGVLAGRLGAPVEADLPGGE